MALIIIPDDPAPAELAITLAEAKTHLRVTAPGDDGLIRALISAAISKLEAELGRAICPRTYRYSFGPNGSGRCAAMFHLKMSFGDIDLVSAAYDGVPIDLEDVTVQEDPTGAVYVAFVPAEAYAAKLISVTYKVNAELPPEARAAALLLIGHMYENREASIVGTSVNTLPMGVEYLVQHLRVSVGV